MEDKRDVEAILVFLKALYLSISTATLCGWLHVCSVSEVEVGLCILACVCVNVL